MARKEDARDSPDAPNPEQMRTPDITASDGKVYDLKFTRADGSIDPWGSRPAWTGARERGSAAINRQAGVDKAMSLDKKSCKCAEREDEHVEPKPVEVEVDVNSIFYVPAPVTEPAPPTGGLPKVPSPPLVPEQAPARVPMPGVIPRLIWP